MGPCLRGVHDERPRPYRDHRCGPVQLPYDHYGALAGLTSGDSVQAATARSKLVGSVSAGTLEQLYRGKLQGATPSELATIVDLHRIALTYVTNKKGGDQIMAAEFEETRKRHAERQLPITDLRTDLITGSVVPGGNPENCAGSPVAARARPSPWSRSPTPFAQSLPPQPSPMASTSRSSTRCSLRGCPPTWPSTSRPPRGSAVLMSALSSSSPTPSAGVTATSSKCSTATTVSWSEWFRRPPSTDGQAVPSNVFCQSFIQAYLAGVRYIGDFYTAGSRQEAHPARPLLDPFHRRPLQEPVKQGPSGPGHLRVRRESRWLGCRICAGWEAALPGIIREKVETLLTNWARDALGEQRSLMSYFSAQPSVMHRPMTSLRDVDEAGVITFGHRDLDGRHGVSDAVARAG